MMSAAPVWGPPDAASLEDGLCFDSLMDVFGDGGDDIWNIEPTISPTVDGWKWDAADGTTFGDAASRQEELGVEEAVSLPPSDSSSDSGRYSSGQSSPSGSTDALFTDLPWLASPNRHSHTPAAVSRSAAPNGRTSSSTASPVSAPPPSNHLVYVLQPPTPAASPAPAAVLPLCAPDVARKLKLLHSSANARAAAQPYPAILPKATPAPPVLTQVVPVKLEAPLVCRPLSRAPPPSPPDANALDAQHCKREQRKVRNREAAQQSRQRRKEFVETVQSKLDQYSHENTRLQRENADLRSKLNALFIENERLKRGRSLPRTATVAKASAVCVLTFMLFFTLNFGSFLSRFSPTPLIQSAKGGDYEMARFHGRSLMAVDLDAELSPPLPDAARVRRSVPLNESFVDRANCSHLKMNRSESDRLTDELSSWMKRHQTVQSETSFSAYRINVPQAADGASKAGRFKASGEAKTKDRMEGKSAKSNKLPPNVESKLNNRASQIGPSEYHLQPYLGNTGDLRYLQLLQALQRRDDTFYLLSLRDYLVLPATNATQGRPRMSLVVPALPLNKAVPPHHVAMMRIECDVTGTGLMYFPESALPATIRPTAA